MFVVAVGDYLDVGVLTAGRTAKGKGRSRAGEESRLKRGGTSRAQSVEEEKFAKSMVERAAWTSRWSRRGRCEATGSIIGILPLPSEFEETTSYSSTALRAAMHEALESLESWFMPFSSSWPILLLWSRSSQETQERTTSKGPWSDIGSDTSIGHISMGRSSAFSADDRGGTRDLQRWGGRISPRQGRLGHDWGLDDASEWDGWVAGKMERMMRAMIDGFRGRLITLGIFPSFAVSLQSMIMKP
jgi:hypothetical protein